MLEASGLLNETPGAPLPASDAIGEIAAFGDRQTGQLDKANTDKRGARSLTRKCLEWQAKAMDEAKRRNRPWWRIW